MQQSSATTSLHLSFWGLRKIVACSHSSSQCLLVSTVFGTVSSLHPTSFLISDFYTCIFIIMARIRFIIGLLIIDIAITWILSVDTQGEHIADG